MKHNGMQVIYCIRCFYTSSLSWRWCISIMEGGYWFSDMTLLIWKLKGDNLYCSNIIRCWQFWMQYHISLTAPSVSMAATVRAKWAEADHNTAWAEAQKQLWPPQRDYPEENCDLTSMVVTVRVLFASFSETLISRLVEFIARVLLEYQTPI